MALEKFLKKLGLEEKDQKVYIALLKLGDASVSRIARESKTKRTTTYHILQKLKEKGLISSYTEKGLQRFAAESPSKLRDAIEGQLSGLEKYLPQLQSFYNSAKARPTVKVFEGEEGAKQISEDALGAKEKIIYSMGSIKTMKEAIGISIRFTKRRIAKKIFEKALRIKREVDDAYIQRQKAELKEVRFFSGDMFIPVLIMMYDNKIGVICSQEEGASFIIESEDFSKTMKSLFLATWEISNTA